MGDVLIFKPVTLKVEKLTLVRSLFFELGPLNLTLTTPGLVYIEGGNGFGKTTFLRAIAGLFTPTKGSIELSPLTRIMLTDHKRGLLPELTVQDHLHFWQKFYKATPEQAKKALTYFKLTSLKTRRIKFLSEGQRQRLSLLRLLLGNAPIWLLDEPLSALDKAGTELLSGMIQEHIDQGGLALMATHLRLPLKKFSTYELPQGIFSKQGAAT